MRPFLKWLGNKHSCLKHILPHLPNAPRLIEPFTGSGAIFLASEYDNYLLGEKNKDLVNLYTLLRKDNDKFIKKAKKMFSGEFNDEDTYYKLREEFNATRSKQRRAILFLYLNRHGYNGLCRYNSSGGFNVPFGRYSQPYFPEKELLFFAEKAKHATFEHADFEHTMQQVSSSDVIYCDPPYVPLSPSASFTAYTQGAFSKEQQEQLVIEAEHAANKGATVLISNHDTDETREYYKNATTIHSFSVKRVVSSNTKQRHPVQELLAIYNPLI